MLKRLNEWRAQRSEQQLAAFDLLLTTQCAGAISQLTVTNRYQGSFHKALINAKALKAARETHRFTRPHSASSASLDAGTELTRKMAERDGILSFDKLDTQEVKSAAILLQRGVIFEQDEHYCLPAEFVIELRSKRETNHWLDLVCNTTLPMLMQIVPAEAQADMPKPKATRNELAAWLAVEGKKNSARDLSSALSESDWSLLLMLEHRHISDFDTLQKLFPDMQAVQVTQRGYYSNRQVTSLRRSLEAYCPPTLARLCHLGLIAIHVNKSRDEGAVTLCNEGHRALAPLWKEMRHLLSIQLEQHWKAEACTPQHPSPWSEDQLIWKLWTALHFMPQRLTQQGKLRKTDLKQIAARVHESDLEKLESLLISMLTTGLLEHQDGTLLSNAICWSAWAERERANIIKVIQGWNFWAESDVNKAINLLAELPVSCWLKLDEVIEWLDMHADGKLVSAQWYALLTENKSGALHHVGNHDQSIYFLPLFRDVLQEKDISLPAPGWYGADKKARIQGFITAAGEIQLPPDCKHDLLPALAELCTLTSVEQMITLQLDEKALQRMATDKPALMKAKTILESLQTPLPQAISYLFDKQAAQKPAGSVAATSMVVLLHDMTAIHKLNKTGFSFSQPFKDKPEIVLLDASADANLFLTTCSEAGILLDPLIKPLQWVTGTASIKAWMEVVRNDQWLELYYQKTRNSQPKQIYACLDEQYYEGIEVRPVRKTKQGFSFLKRGLQLGPKHILKIRILDQAELTEIGLDQLA